MYDEVEKKKVVNSNELLMLCAQVEANFKGWVNKGVRPKSGLKSSLMFGLTCDVAITSLDFFRKLDTYEHYASVHNFWGVSFGGEVRGLFIISPYGYAIMMTDRRSMGEMESLFKLGNELMKVVEMLEDLTTDEEEFIEAVYNLDSTDGFESHVYSLITRDDSEVARKRDLRLFSWSFPDVFTSVNNASSARREFQSYGETVIGKYTPAKSKQFLNNC